MRHKVDYCQKLFFMLALLLGLNCIWVTGITAIHGFISLEGIVSAYRLLFSLFLAYSVYKYFTIFSVSNYLFWVALMNSAIILIQLCDGVVGFELLPEWLKYGWLYGVEDVELWRKGGLLPSLQTSSLLSIVGLYIGARIKSSGIMLIAFPILCIAILIGSRTFAPIGFIVIVYSFLRMPILVFGWSLILIQILTGLSGFWDFFELRFMGLHEVFFGLDVSADYSALDTMRSYRNISFSELIFGNGHARYTEFGGGDPFYTRWLYQSGGASLLLLFSALFLIAHYCGRFSQISYMIFIIVAYHNIKGELFTSVVVFDFICIFAFVFIESQKLHINVSKDLSPNVY